MKKLSVLLILGTLLCIPRLHAQDNAVRLTRFEGQRITGIISNCGFDIQLTQGSNTGATVEINRELEKYLDFSLENGILSIVLKNDKKQRNFGDWLNNYRLRRATVTVSALDKISVSSSARITASGTFTGKNVSLRASSSSWINGVNVQSDGGASVSLSSSAGIQSLNLTATGNIEVKGSSSASLHQFVLNTSGNINMGGSSSCSIKSGTLKANDISLNASSSGGIRDCRLDARGLSAVISSSATMSLSGQVQTASFQGSSSGRIRAEGLTTTDATASMSSSSSLTLRVTGVANFHCNSSGSIRYSGNPDIQRQDASSGGRISAL